MRAASVVMLPHTPASVGAARRRLTRELRAAGVTDANVADANLVLSELVSNALRHARPLRDGRIRADWRLVGATLVVEVTDGGATTRPRVNRPSLTSPGGRGLSIVAHLARSWGTRDDAEGTTVWAVLPVAHRRPSARPMLPRQRMSHA